MSDPVLTSAVCALVAVLKCHEKNIDPQSLEHELSGKEEAVELYDLVRVAKRLGMKARRVSVRPEQLIKAPLPFIGQGHNNEYFVIAFVDPEQETVLVLFAGQPPCSLSFVGGGVVLN